MNSVERMKSQFEKVFTHEQAEVLAVAIDHAYSELVKTSDFNELKDIVKNIGIKVTELADAQNRTESKVEELADAQNRTETKVEELAEAQKRTENKVEKLVDAQMRTQIAVEGLAEAQKRTEEEVRHLAAEHKETRQQLGGLAQSVGYGLEDKLFPFIWDFAKKNYQVDVESVERKYMVYPDGRSDELNIYAEGRKHGKKAFVIGECKAQPGKRDADKFKKIIERVKNVVDGEVFYFIVGYSIAPEKASYINDIHPEMKMFKSYEFDMNYKPHTNV